MSVFVLDTDHVSLFQRVDARVTQQIMARPPSAIAVTVVTFEEQMRGWLVAIRRAANKAQLVGAYRRLRSALDYFGSAQLLDFDDSSHELYEELRREKVRIGTQDLRIAAIVLSRGAVLVTRNAKDFSKVPGLAIEDWST